jgi:hypothetical protein
MERGGVVNFRVKAPVTRCPPHRSGRAGLPHPVPRFRPFLLAQKPNKAHPVWRTTMLPLPVGTTGSDTLRRSCGDTVCGLGVPPVVPFNRTLCPASPSLQWVPWVSVPHLIGLGIHCNHGPRYYDPLRLPNAHLRFVRSSLSSPDTLFAPLLSLTGQVGAAPFQWQDYTSLADRRP